MRISDWSSDVCSSDLINRYKPNQDFGQTGAGLIVRIPFAEQNVWIDKRVQSVEMERQQVLSTDQLRLQVDAFARYRVVDPLRMYITAGHESRVSAELRPILGRSEEHTSELQPLM